MIVWNAIQIIEAKDLLFYITSHVWVLFLYTAFWVVLTTGILLL